MRELGITYKDCEPRSLGDDWLFFDCDNVPTQLPPFLSVTDLPSSASIYEQGLRRVATTLPPAGQKFPPGARVRVAEDLGSCMSHFPSGCDAIVLYTYAHAYGGNSCDQYAVDIDGRGFCAWYEERQLSLIDQN